MKIDREPREQSLKSQLGFFVMVGFLTMAFEVAFNYFLWFYVGLHKSLTSALTFVACSSAIAFGLVKACTYLCAMALNFSLNRSFTFRGRSRNPKSQAVRFFVVSACGLLISSFIASIVQHLWTDQGRSGWLVAILIGNGLATAWTFTMHRSYTFK